MRILFSPIGKADPLTILGDGPMLHIARHYCPDKVILLLSPRMAPFEKDESRYSRAIELLSLEMNRDTPEIIPVYSQHDEPHRYDHYIAEFEEELSRLRCDYPDAEILVNVTSGTPAMGQALVAIDAFDRLGLRALQVETPRKGDNKEGDREDLDNLDFDTLWELNEDKGGERPNRCIEVGSANFGDLILRDNIRTLIEGYDYTAALQLARQCRSIPEEARKLVEGCVYRLNIDRYKAPDFFKGTSFSYDPSKQLSEYLWMLEVCLKREQWADYLRAITPALYETFFMLVREYLPDEDWLKKATSKNTKRRIDVKKVQASSELSKAFRRIGLHENETVFNRHLCMLVEHYYQSTSRCKQCKKLRDLEDGARNPLAHAITRIDKELLESEGGMKLEESLAVLFKLNETQPGLYERINKAILELL